MSSTCTVVEIEDNGADDVAYECIVGFGTECVDDQTVDWPLQEPAGSSFVVTNTFSDAPPPPPPPDTSADDLAPVDGGPVAASPGFTG